MQHDDANIGVALPLKNLANLTMTSFYLSVMSNIHLPTDKSFPRSC